MTRMQSLAAENSNRMRFLIPAAAYLLGKPISTVSEYFG